MKYMELKTAVDEIVDSLVLGHVQATRTKEKILNLLVTHGQSCYKDGAAWGQLHGLPVEALATVRDKLVAPEPFGYLISYGWYSTRLSRICYKTIATRLPPTELLKTLQMDETLSHTRTTDVHLTFVQGFDEPGYRIAEIPFLAHGKPRAENP